MDPPAPRPEAGVVVALVTDGGVILDETPGFAAALVLVIGGVTPNGISPPAPLVLVVEDVIPRDTLIALTGNTTNRDINAESAVGAGSVGIGC